MSKRVAPILLHLGSAITFTALIFLLLSLYSRLHELRDGLDSGFDVVGTYQNINQGTYAAVDLTISKSETSETELIWRARDCFSDSGAADALGHRGIVEATADPNGFHLQTDGEDLVATLHLSRGGSQEELVLYLDLLNREDLLKFDKVADSVMEWEE